MPIDMKSISASSTGSWKSSAGTSSIAPTLICRGSSPPVVRTRRDLHVEKLPGEAELADLGDHREHDVEVLARRRLDQGAELLAQHGRPVEGDADRPPAHRRIFVLGRGPRTA